MSQQAPVLPGMFSEPSQVADTSREAYRRLQPLTPLNLLWLLRVYDYLDATGAADVTGAELAEHYGYYGALRTDSRPRLTQCCQRGWLVKGEPRQSRAAQEGVCRGYRPTLPMSAVERAQRTQGKA